MRTRQNILSKYMEISSIEDIPPSDEEIERRIALYTQRAEYGVDLFDETILSESPLTATAESGTMGSLEFDWADELESILNEQE